MDFPDKNIIIFLNCNQLQPIFLFSHTLICTETNVYSHMLAEPGRKSIFNVLCIIIFTILTLSVRGYHSLRTPGGGVLNTPPLKSHLGLFLGEFFNTNQNIYIIVGYMQKIGSKTSKTAKWQPFKKKFGRKTTYP